MAFSTISKNYSNIFVKQLLLHLKGVELSVETLPGFSAIVTGDSSLLNCHKPLDVFKYLSLYSIELYIGIIIWRFSASSRCSSFMWVMHFKNGKQSLNATLIIVLPPVATIFPVTRIYVSQKSPGLNNFNNFYFNRNGWITFISSRYYALFWWLITYHFLVANFEGSLSASLNKLTILLVSIFIHGQN